MSVFTRSAAARAARLTAVPAAAALAVVVAAGPALAAGTSVGIYTGGTVSHGRLAVDGVYQCASGSPYAALTVTVTQAGPHRHVVESSVVERVACTGATLRWSATLAPQRHEGRFGPGATRVTVKLSMPGDRRGQAGSSLVLNAVAS
jgi:hypothetical protein